MQKSLQTNEINSSLIASSYTLPLAHHKFATNKKNPSIKI